MTKKKTAHRKNAKNGIQKNIVRQSKNMGPATNDPLSSMTMGALITRYPATLPLLFEAGIHCIGCHGAAHETIDVGLANHGLSPGKIATLKKKIKLVMATKGFIMTKSAVLACKNVLATKKGYGIRISHDQKTGQFMFSFENKKKTNDTMTQHMGLAVYVDQKVAVRLVGALIDYVHTPQGEGFIVRVRE
jgi:hybrid cluster-associated redox disulfide protein